jgi:hypothetical protein
VGFDKCQKTKAQNTRRNIYLRQQDKKEESKKLAEKVESGT